MRSNSSNSINNLNSVVFVLVLLLKLSSQSFCCCGIFSISDLDEATDESSSTSSSSSGSETALVSEPDNDCQYGIRRLLREYDAFHHEEEILFPPILQAAISKCINGDNGYDDGLCEVSSYEWIALNVAGMYRKFAEHELITLATNIVKLKGEAQELKAEQHELDQIMGYISDARRFFEQGKLCHDVNRQLILSKAHELEENVVKTVILIQVEVKRFLRSNRSAVSSSKTKTEKSPRKVELVEAATCPNEVKEIHSQMILEKSAEQETSLESNT